jgi:hypothetical protein
VERDRYSQRSSQAGSTAAESVGTLQCSSSRCTGIRISSSMQAMLVVCACAGVGFPHHPQQCQPDGSNKQCPGRGGKLSLLCQLQQVLFLLVPWLWRVDFSLHLCDCSAA